MSIQVLYTCVPGVAKTLSLCTRFVATYHEFSAGFEHDLIVICNGKEPDTALKAALSTVNAKIFVRSNDGWDIGGYREWACMSKADLMVCLGESVYFHRAGWLDRILDAYTQYGDGMYGFWASKLVRPHLLTTAFATRPYFLMNYPHPTRDKKQRYEFEHGRNSFLRWLQMKRFQTRLVTWDGCWPEELWRSPQNIMWRGDQSNCLAYCNHTDNYKQSTIETKRKWESLANGFK